MNRVTYSRGRMLLIAAFFGLLLGFFLFAFFNPEELASVRRARALTSGFGRAFLLPMFIAICGAFVWRGLSVGLIDPGAIEFTSTHLRLHAFWGWKQVRWSDVANAQIEWHANYPNLLVETRSGALGRKRIRVPLGVANLHPSQTGELLDIILKRAVSPGRIVEEVPEGTGFDPDAAIARYLDRKGSQPSAAGSSSTPEFSPSLPPRPVFGKKVI